MPPDPAEKPTENATKTDTTAGDQPATPARQSTANAPTGRVAEPEKTGTNTAVTKTSDEEEPDFADPDVELKPNKEGMVTLPIKAFLKRVSRMSKRELQSNFGTTKLEDIVAERQELVALRKEKAERERAEMSEREKLAADLKAAEEKRAAAEARANEVEMARNADRVERTLERRARSFFADKYVDVALDAMAKEARKNPKKNWNDEAAQASWFEAYAKDHPELTPSGKAAKEKEPKDRVHSSTGKERPESNPAKSQEVNKQNARPGGGMSKTDIKKAYGVNW